MVILFHSRPLSEIGNFHAARITGSDRTELDGQRIGLQNKLPQEGFVKHVITNGILRADNRLAELPIKWMLKCNQNDDPVKSLSLDFYIGWG